jgi:hypothetical protein
VLVCDVTCGSNAGCQSVNKALTCMNGFCRGPEIDAGAPPIDASVSSNDAALPSCTWPSYLQQTDASPWACHAGRAYLQCSLDNGGGSGCISDDGKKCAGLDKTYECKNACESNEYAVTCGGPPRPSRDGSVEYSYEEPPVLCRLVSALPSGAGFYCCPCMEATVSPSDSGTAAGKASCRVAYQTYPSGTTNIAPPSGCGSCVCNDGELTCSQSDCPTGVPVIPCPTGGNVITDPITVKDANITGDTLTLNVTHGGGCAQHDYALCYVEFGAWSDSRPVIVTTKLIHDAHGDGCEALLSKTLKFDLSPIARVYEEAFLSKGGVVNTEYGQYAFGKLTCQERSNFMSILAPEAIASYKTCLSDADCSVQAINAKCYFACNAAIYNRAYQQQIEEAVTNLENKICGDYEAEGCPALIHPCTSPPSAACVDGTCS